MRVFRLAFVDPRYWYSPELKRDLNKMNSHLSVYIYSPKWPKNESLRKKIYSPKEMEGGSGLWTTFLYPFQVFRKARFDRVNLVHIQWELNIFGNFYASLLLPLLLLFLRCSNIKRVVTVHSVIPKASFSSKSKGFLLPDKLKTLGMIVFHFLYKLVGLLSNAIFVHGKLFKELLVHDYGLKREKIFPVPYGVPSKPISNGQSALISSLTKRKIILAWGTIGPRKGLDILIKAFGKLASENPDWSLVIAGGFPHYYVDYYLYLKDLASEQKHDRIVFLNHLNLENMHSLLSSADIVVFPYIYNYGASSTLTFAFQHRKMIVISALKFVKEQLVDGKNAILVPPGNADALADGIKRAINDRDLRASIPKEMNKIAYHHSWSNVAKKTLEVYEQVVFAR